MSKCIRFAWLGSCLLVSSSVFAEPLPEGVKSSGFYEVDITSMTDAAVAYLNDGPFQKRDGFRLQLVKGVTDKDLERVRELPWLQKLYLTRLGEPTNLGLLGPLPELHTIHLSTSATNYEALAKLPKLQTLQISDRITSIAFVKGLSQLKQLHLPETVEDYSPLVGSTSLVALSVPGIKKDSKLLAPLNTLTNLEDLRLGSRVIKDLSSIANCTKLRKLSCTFCEELSDISAIAKFTDLEELGLWGTKVSDISALAKCEKLKWLQLSGTPVTDLTPLAKLPDLRYLQLTGSAVTELRPLASCAALKTVDLGDLKITSIDPLLSVKTLGYVTLPKALPEEVIEKLKKAFPKAKIMTR